MPHRHIALGRRQEVDLVQRLRTTEASRYTVRDTPSFTCIAMSLERALNALDGERLGAEALPAG